MSGHEHKARGRETEAPAGIACQVLGLTPRTMQRLVSAGVLPRPIRHGVYDLAALVGAYLEHRIEQAQDEAPGPPGSARDRWWTARAALAELELAERQRAVVPAQHVTRALEFLATTFRARLLALPRKLAVQLSPEDPHATEQTIDTEARAILAELAEDPSLPHWLADGNAARDDAGPGGSDRNGTQGAPPAT